MDRQMDTFMRSLNAALTPTLRALHDGAEAGVRAVNRALHQAKQARRVHAAMPRLTMRAVMVHGLVPFRAQPTTETEN